MRCILSPAPLDLVDFLFYLQRLEVVEFRFVRLKFGVKFVLAGFFLSQVSFRCRFEYKGFKGSFAEIH